MEDRGASRVLTISSAGAAKAIRDPATLSQLSPFLARERTISEVARSQGVPVSTQFRRVQRFVRLGLLEVSRTVRRNGKPTKLYRSVADSFFVPSEVSEEPAVWSGTWNRYWDEEFDRSLTEACSEWFPRWGHQVWRDAAGVLNISLVRRPFEPVDLLALDSPAVVATSHDALYLDFEDAKAMQREVDAIWRKYAAIGGSQRYLARIQLTPARSNAPIVE